MNFGNHDTPQSPTQTADRRTSVAQKARKSVANFLGVSDVPQPEWQHQMEKWQRRSIALHQSGKLLGRLDSQRLSKKPEGKSTVSTSEIPKSKPRAVDFEAVVGAHRPSVFRLAYEGIKDKMEASHFAREESRSGIHSGLEMSKQSGKRKPEVKKMEHDLPERELGKGVVGELLHREYRKSRLVSEVRINMASLSIYRPFFTYWVTFVQIVIYIVTVSIYGLGPIGISQRKITGSVPKIHISIESAFYMEEENLWIGPSASSLIHLGAKFSPCMRKDTNIEMAIAADREKEKETACCIFNDGSGCVQTKKSACSDMMSLWNKWPDKHSRRTSGSVCGQDPRLCENPPPGISTWPDDISKWPVCMETADVAETDSYAHMNCELIGRPCCIGIQGECIITSDQHCKFLNGYFHPNATLCSQIYCMNAICGMIPFYKENVPDQFGRFITSQFMHAGLLQLCISILFQGFVMRDLEKLIGWVRMAIIYIFSGIAGSLGSAIFLPYDVEAGPSGATFGVSACLFVEVIQNWYILYQPWLALFKLVAIFVGFFILGLLPMIDNYSHLFGLFYGFLLAFALMPYITFNLSDRRHKLIAVTVCLVLAVVVLLILIIVFYVTPIRECDSCKYFNCVPFASDFCIASEIKIKRQRGWFS